MSLPVVELFPALQGEGNRMGVPSFFVRLGGCNLTCSGFGCIQKSPITNEELSGCDSIHAVNAKHFKHEWDHYDDFNELVSDIEDNMIYEDRYGHKPDIVITGGEPMIHHKDDVMINMIEYFHSRGHEIHIETNGTIPVDFDVFDVYRNVHFTMSVKMSASGEPINKRWRSEVVNEYLRNTKDSIFKFVLSEESLEKEAEEVLDFLKQVPTYAKVYCMPLGGTKEEVQENAKDVYEFALNNSFNYSDRLHIRIYDDMKLV